MNPWEEAAAAAQPKMPWEEAAAGAGGKVPETPGAYLGPARSGSKLDTGMTGITPDSSRMPLKDRVVNWLSNVGASGMSALSNIVAPNPTGALPGQELLHEAQTDPHPLSTAVQRVKSVVPNPQDISQHKLDTAAQLVGQAGATGMVEETPAILENVGAGLKNAGGFVADKTAVGSNAIDRQFGAKPGKGLSENRIVGMTKAGLATKVKGAAGKLADERTAILAPNTQTTNIGGLVSQPFDELRAKVTNPRTGVADPAEIAALGRTQAAALVEQHPYSGKPMVDYSTVDPEAGGLPRFRNLTDLTPAEIAEYNSNLRGMGNYAAKESPLAEQAVKQAGHNLRTKMTEVAPEATDVTRRMYDTESAEDILKRGLSGEGGTINPPTTLTKAMFDATAKPAMRGAGTAIGAGLDIAGSRLQTLGEKLRLPTRTTPTPAQTGMTVRPAGPPPAGASAPVPPQPQGMAPPQPTGAIPAVAGPTTQVPPASAPPNVSLKERVSGFPQPYPEVRPLGSNAGVVGPEGPGQFAVSPRRLTAGGENAVQEPKTGSVLQHAPENAGGARGGRGRVEPGKQGEGLASQVKGKSGKKSKGRG